MVNELENAVKVAVLLVTEGPSCVIEVPLPVYHKRFIVRAHD